MLMIQFLNTYPHFHTYLYRAYARFNYWSPLHTFIFSRLQFRHSHASMDPLVDLVLDLFPYLRRMQTKRSILRNIVVNVPFDSSTNRSRDQGQRYLRSDNDRYVSVIHLLRHLSRS